MDTRIRKSPLVWLVLAVTAACITGGGCRPARAPQVLEISGATMGTLYQIKVVPREPAEPDIDALRSLIEAELDAVNTRMSTYDPDSELSRFNAHASTEPFPVSEMTFGVFQMAQEISEQTRGAFDITIGLLVNAWGFGPAALPNSSPTEDEIQALLRHTGFEKIHLDADNLTVQKDDPAVYCDLAGIAKGYAVDRVCLALEKAGFPDYMVEIGGEVRTGGLNAEGVPWRIGIIKPDIHAAALEQIVPISGWALATSGDYRNFYERDGERYSHTIDPRTGRPVAHNLASASVIHNEAAAADAYATALMVMGFDEGLRWAEENGLAVLLIARETEGGFRSAATQAFDDFIASATEKPVQARR